MRSSDENKSCMRVDKQEFAWEFHQLSCPGQTRTVWELTSKSLHESWQARVCMRVSSTLMCSSDENKSCMRVDKREFAWEFHQLSCPCQTRTRVAWELTSESLHESFINSHVLVKRKQELHESWQARVYMRVSSTLMSWSYWQDTSVLTQHGLRMTCCRVYVTAHTVTLTQDHPSGQIFGTCPGCKIQLWRFDLRNIFHSDQ